MNSRWIVFLLISLWLNTSLADQISVPNRFVAGERATAAEVNDNFEVLESEVNAHDNRIATLEAHVVQSVDDQLICVAFYQWPIDGSAYNCVTRSDPSNIRPLTYAAVAQESWVLVSVGGDGSNRTTYVFSR
jgi:hypothetical protein